MYSVFFSHVSAKDKHGALLTPPIERFYDIVCERHYDGKLQYQFNCLNIEKLRPYAVIACIIPIFSFITAPLYGLERDHMAIMLLALYLIGAGISLFYDLVKNGLNFKKRIIVEEGKNGLVRVRFYDIRGEMSYITFERNLEHEALNEFLDKIGRCGYSSKMDDYDLVRVLPHWIARRQIKVNAHYIGKQI